MSLDGLHVNQNLGRESSSLFKNPLTSIGILFQKKVDFIMYIHEDIKGRETLINFGEELIKNGNLEDKEKFIRIIGEILGIDTNLDLIEILVKFFSFTHNFIYASLPFLSIFSPLYNNSKIQDFKIKLLISLLKPSPLNYLIELNHELFQELKEKIKALENSQGISGNFKKEEFITTMYWLIINKFPISEELIGLYRHLLSRELENYLYGQISPVMKDIKLSLVKNYLFSDTKDNPNFHIDIGALMANSSFTGSSIVVFINSLPSEKRKVLVYQEQERIIFGNGKIDISIFDNDKKSFLDEIKNAHEDFNEELEFGESYSISIFKEDGKNNRPPLFGINDNVIRSLHAA